MRSNIINIISYLQPLPDGLQQVWDDRVVPEICKPDPGAVHIHRAGQEQARTCKRTVERKLNYLAINKKTPPKHSPNYSSKDIKYSLYGVAAPKRIVQIHKLTDRKGLVQEREELTEGVTGRMFSTIPKSRQTVGQWHRAKCCL